MISHDTFRLLLLIAFGLIVFSLGTALTHMLHPSSRSKRMLKALTWRVSLSVGVIVFLVLGKVLGLVEPKQQLPPAGPAVQHAAPPDREPD